MKKSLLAALCTDLLSIVIITGALAQTASEPRYRVQIEAPRELREMLQKGLNLVRWQNDAGLTPALLDRLVDEAVRETRQAAAAEGWFTAKVDAQVDRAREPWTVTLRVEPGPRTQVGSVDLKVIGPAADDPQARARIESMHKSWSLRTGQPFRQSAWDAAKQNAVRELAVWRYAAARIAESSAVVDPDAHKATLSVTVDSGPPFRFGAIEVRGGQRHDASIARNLGEIEPGATYDADELLKYERTLLEAGYYVSAHAAVEPDPAQADAVPVRVSVIEGPSQNLDVGLHLNTDTGFRTELLYKDNDLFNRSYRMTAKVQTGLKEQGAGLNFDLPPRSDGTWINPFTRIQRSDVENLRTSEFAVGVALNHGSIASPSGPIVSYHIEDHKVSGASTDTRRALFLAYRYAFRRTDDFLLPRQGYIGTSSIGFAPSGVSTQRFGRVHGRAVYLHPLGADDLAVRLELGAVLARSRVGVPSSFLFRTGGDQTVRGYAFESLGVAEGNAIVGGRYLAVASVEATHWIGANWGIAVFVDAGDAWDEAGRFDPALGYGFGGRIRTPIGPVRADLAYGEREKKLRLHFSIGFTF